MPSEAQARLHEFAQSRSALRVVEFLKEPTALLQRAERVISMGGYNAICEILSFGVNALIVPRVKPRLEQLIRAERMSQLGLLDFLHPHEVTPDAIAAWLKQDLLPPAAHSRIDMHGLIRIPALLSELLPAQPYSTRLERQTEVYSHAVP